MSGMDGMGCRKEKEKEGDPERGEEGAAAANPTLSCGKAVFAELQRHSLPLEAPIKWQ